jgi:hypothetical protein
VQGFCHLHEQIFAVPILFHADGYKQTGLTSSVRLSYLILPSSVGGMLRSVTLALREAVWHLYFFHQSVPTSNSFGLARVDS